MELRAAVSDEYDWESLTGETGLSDLDLTDPACPAALKQLLSPHGDPLVVWMVGLVMSVLYLCFVSMLFSFVEASWQAFVMAVIPTVALSVVTSLGVAHGLEGWARWRGHPLPLTAAAARLRALDALRAEPFVIWAGGRLVENVPALSTLTSWLRELEDQEDAVRDRLNTLDTLIKRSGALLSSLGESGQDPHVAALEACRAEEHALLERVKTTRSQVRGRARELEENLTELRQRAELETVRQVGAQLTGRAMGTEGLQIATDLELDTGALDAAMVRLRTDLESERLRARALTEVSGLG